MEDTKLTLNQYEVEVLTETLADYQHILDEKIKVVHTLKHLDNDKKKNVKRSLQNKKNLLNAILSKIV